jgi:transposase
LEGIKEIFNGRREKASENKEKQIDELYRQIGKLKVENEWLKRNCTV